MGTRRPHQQHHKVRTKRAAIVCAMRGLDHGTTAPVEKEAGRLARRQRRALKNAEMREK